MKTCTSCHVSKVLTDFYREKRGAQGVKGKCKACCELVKKAYRQHNPDKLKDIYSKYMQKEDVQRRLQLYRPIATENQKRFYQNNKAKFAAYGKEYYVTHSLQRNQYQREKYANDPQARLSRCLRSRMRHALNHNTKTKKSEELIGCSFLKLKNHLESLFKPGMSWENYGHKGWHIDHIEPCIMFDLSLQVEQQKCFHWSNLQPLWAADNFAKGGTFDVDNDCLSSIYLLFEP